MHGHAGLAVSSNRNPDNKTADEVVAEMGAHLIPGGLLIPAAVVELVRLQAKNYGLVVNH